MSLLTLWYAFLISALVAERSMFKTSMLVSHGYENWSGAIRRTVEIPLFGHLDGRCGLCVCANSQFLRSYVGNESLEVIKGGLFHCKSSRWWCK